MRSWGLCLVACMGVGCGGAAGDPTAEMRGNETYPCVENAGLFETPSFARPTLDGRFADIARITPGGFGGFFREGGKAHAYLIDLSRAPEAEVVLAEELGYSGISFRQGRYDWLQLFSCYHTLVTGRLWDAGVTATDIQESLNRIVLFVPHEGEHERAVRELIDELRIPQDMVVFERAGEITTF